MRDLNKYFPTDIGLAEQYKSDFYAYVPEMILTISKYYGKPYAGGYYAHNIIPELQKMDVFKNWDIKLLSHFAYVTNSYLGAIDDEKKAKEREMKYLEAGYTKLTPEVLKTLPLQKRYFAVRQGENSFGQIYDLNSRLNLLHNEGMGYFFVKTLRSSKGLLAERIEFIKAA